MTERLYYRDSFLREFPATVLEVVPGNRAGIVLDRTAFYPTSGGQLFDTGTLLSDKGTARVVEVAEDDGGRILHFIEGDELPSGTQVRGEIDGARRHDHIEQHSGQHVLSAAFLRLFGLETISFHMGDESCSIDLSTSRLEAHQIGDAETLANDIVLEDRPVEIHFVSRAEAQRLGLRTIPPAERDELRLIDIRDFDLTACGGTHVIRTGQIGAILLRKTEKVKQGWRVEFVCGQRAVCAARRDYTILTEAAGRLSSHTADLPQQVSRMQDDLRALRKAGEQLLAEMAELTADRLLAKAQGRRVVVCTFAERDLSFIKLLAQKLTRQAPEVVALLGSKSGAPALVFACSPGMPMDMGALMKEALAKLS